MRSLSVVVCVLLLGGGAWGSQREIAVELEFELPRVTPGERMTLGQALVAADRRNVTLAALREEVTKSQAQLSQAWGLILPVIQADLSYSHADHPDEMDLAGDMGSLFEDLGLPPMEISSEPTILRRQDDVNGSITANLPLVNFKSWYSIIAGREAVDLTRLSVEDARQALLYGVAQAYYVALMSLSLVSLQEEQIRSSAHHLKVAEARFNAEAGLRIDVIRAETDLEKARQDLLDAHLALNTARDSLAVLTGTAGLPLPVDTPPLRAPMEKEESLVRMALEDRPDLWVSRATVGLMERQLTVAWMQFIPTISATWLGSYQFTEPAEMGSTDRSRWTLIFGLTIPIYNHFRYAELDLQRASIEQARLREEDARQRAGQEVRQARRDYLTAMASVENAQRQVTLAKEGLDLVNRAYQAGTGSSLEVTDARRTAASAEVNLITTRLKGQMALLILLRSLGKDILEIGGH